MNQEICIMDYELNSGVDILFQLPVYIYGAGETGQNIEYLLSHTEIDVKCFIDRRAGEIQRNHDIIDIDTFRNKYKPEDGDCIIILTVSSDCSILLNELREKSIFVKHIFTEWAVEKAILSSINDGRFPKELGQDYFSRQLSKEKEKLNDILKCGIWVWQPGKVGSSSVFRTLKKYGIESVHIHNISRLLKEEDVDSSKVLKKVKTEQIKIITLVREPITRDISDYMENYIRHCVMKDTVQDVLIRFAETNHQFSWFDWEIKDLLGIDIFEYPFDRDKGYEYIKKNNIEILIIKLESLDKNVDVLGEFVGIRGMLLEKANEGSKKGYSKIYQEIKDNLVIPQQVIDSYYKGNVRMDHFYSEAEKEAFMKKYEKI